MKYFFILLTLINILKADNFNALKAAHLAQDAYLSPQKFISNNKTNSNKIEVGLHNGVTFFIIKDESEIIVVFRGTDSTKNALVDANIKHTQFLDIKGSFVHNGFYNIALYANTQLSSTLSPTKAITLVGHSLGGGVALLLGAILEHHGYKNIHVYSFGMPPVGNEVFVNSCISLKHERYMHHSDIIPKINKPITSKIKKLVALTKKLTFLQEEQISTTTLAFKKLVNMVSSLPYEFVHQGTLHTLYNQVNYTKTYNFVHNFIQKFLGAHTIQNYINGIKTLH